MRGAIPDWIGNCFAAAVRKARRIAATFPRSCAMDSAVVCRRVTPFTTSASDAQRVYENETTPLCFLSWVAFFARDPRRRTAPHERPLLFKGSRDTGTRDHFACTQRPFALPG